MRVLVCGGREFSDSKMLARVLDDYHQKNEIFLLIQGGQREEKDGRWIGADWLASEWARWREVTFVTQPAKWTRQGRAAGPIRNRHMVNDWGPDVVIAFPGGKGTADMINNAKRAGVPIIEVEGD